nr:alpha-amylase family glycosyl hydrolase [Hyphomonas sp. Mor2]
MTLSRSLLVPLVSALWMGACSNPAPEPADDVIIDPVTAEQSAPAPLFYHIFVRSFHDTNGDRQGDLQGIVEKLDYLQELGVTGILLTPLYPSAFYHNYFADDFYGIDAEFGDMEDYRQLVEALHRRDMVIYLDQEIQYVSGTHEWFSSSFETPTSPFDEFVVYADPGNTEPVATLFGKTEFDVWPAQKQNIYTVNMLDPQVRAYFTDYLLFWMDPNGDGDFSDGVDGYRIDHMMDDLDNAGVLTGLFAEFWRPIFDALRAQRPEIDIIAEQYDWGYGEQFLTAGDTDKVFGFPIWNSANQMDAAGLAEAIETTNAIMTEGKGQFVFIENHDTNRFAHAFADEPEILKLGAAVNLLVGWTPIIYYGQEIGMTGAKAEGPEADVLSASGDDARDIPVRQAFRWSPAPEAEGHAIWYRNPAEAYPLEDSNSEGDGRSVAEQNEDPGSLLNYYRDLAALRAAHPALANGQTAVLFQEDGLILLERHSGPANTVVLAFNFSAEPAALPADLTSRMGEQILGPTTPSVVPAHTALAWKKID